MRAIVDRHPLLQQGLAADLHSDTCASAGDVTCSLFLFFILFYLLIIFCLNLSTFYKPGGEDKKKETKLQLHFQSNGS